MKNLQAIRTKFDEAHAHLDLLIERQGNQRKYIAITKQEIVGQRAEIKRQQIELTLNLDRVARNETARYRSKAQKLAKKYDIYIDDSSSWDGGNYHIDHWVGEPDWLTGSDPLEDGHYSYDWRETLWLVEFYAKHHPEHPDHANREFLPISPHC